MFQTKTYLWLQFRCIQTYFLGDRVGLWQQTQDDLTWGEWKFTVLIWHEVLWPICPLLTETFSFNVKDRKGVFKYRLYFNYAVQCASFLVSPSFANLCFFNLAFSQYIFLLTSLALFNQTAGSALQASLTLADIRLGSIKSCIAMWVIEQRVTASGKITLTYACALTHKQTHTHTQVNTSPHKYLSTHTQSLCNLWNVLTSCVLSHKNGGMTEGFKNLLLCICLAKFPL